MRRRRWQLASLVSVVAALLVAGIVLGWRWRADRAYVGTDSAAELTWGQCLNGIGWTDPTNGAGWWAGHDIVVAGQYESEPVRVHMLQSDDPRTEPIRSVVHTSIGTIHFDAYDKATFSSRTGGTMQLTRPPPGQAYTADCVGGIGNGAEQLPPSMVVWAQVAGVLGHRTDSSGDLVLAKGEIRIDQNGIQAEAVPVSGQAPFSVNVPVGTVTLRGADDRGDCGSVTVTVAAGDHVNADLICERP